MYTLGTWDHFHTKSNNTEKRRQNITNYRPIKLPPRTQGPHTLCTLVLPDLIWKVFTACLIDSCLTLFNWSQSKICQEEISLHDVAKSEEGQETAPEGFGVVNINWRSQYADEKHSTKIKVLHLTSLFIWHFKQSVFKAAKCPLSLEEKQHLSISIARFISLCNGAVIEQEYKPYFLETPHFSQIRACDDFIPPLHINGWDMDQTKKWM